MNHLVNTSTLSGIIEATSSSITIADKIQIAIVVVTFLAVLVALFSERLWKYMERPKITLSFDKSSDRCYRWADLNENNVQDEGRHRNVRKQYFRLKIANNGSLAKKLKVKVNIFYKNKKEVDRFEPSSLAWISGDETIDLAKGESEYINFLSQVIHSPTKITNRLTVEIFDTKPRGIAWDRPLKTYYYRLTVYGENIKPLTYLAKFTANKDINKPGSIRELRKV